MAGVSVAIIGAMCVHCQSIVLHIVRRPVEYIGTNPKCTVVGSTGYECAAPMAELEEEEIDVIFDSHKTVESEDQ